MPYLIVSDIHGNREALEAVLSDAEGQYDIALCLGDLVGYGADPNFAIDWARANAAAIVRGNHDKASAGLDPIDSYREAARTAVQWTHNELTEENLDYLRNLPRGPLPFHGIDLMHGSPADEDEYLVNAADAALVRGYLDSRVSFFGHTHIQGGFLIMPAGPKRIDPSRTLELEPDYFYLVNPGSVGQPRDGNPHAAYAIYSPEQQTVEFRRAAYDTVKAAEKIRASGLPETLAMRLLNGI